MGVHRWWMAVACCVALGCGGDDDGAASGTDPFVPTAGGTENDDSAGSSGTAGSDDNGSQGSNTDSADPSVSSTSDDTDPVDTDDPTGTETTGPVGGPAGSCGAGGGTGGEVVQITLDSPERWYLIGAQDSDEPLPLVLAFHGDEGDPFNSTRFIWGSWWEQTNPQMHVVMTKCPGCTSWYQGDTDYNAQYVWDVLADVAANHNVDVSRNYAVGYSGGSEFLSIHGWEFQDTFAGIQYTCGGNAYRPYLPPPREDCKVRGRIVISQDDFLWDSAQDLLARLQSEGHEHEYVDAQCSGHCCDTEDHNQGAWEWFQTVTKCGAEVPGECAEITTLPPMAGQLDTNRWAPADPPSSEGPLQPPAPLDFAEAREQFDAVMDQLASANGSDDSLLREAIAAYDRMLAAARAHGEDAAEQLQARSPLLRARLAELRQP